MSEYQYYEFAAIDRPLTPTEIAEIRAVSTRAVITPSGFVNHYEWGDLKADPADWIRRYFDAFIYTANWCSCRLALRVPLATFRKAELKPFATKYVLTVDANDEHWIFDWALDESEDYDRFAADDGSGWMPRLMPMRDELLHGDLRPLYLGWLAGASGGELREDAQEPEVPPGLSELSPPQQALVEFLEIDPATPRRSVAELRELAESAAAVRLEREAKERSKQEAERGRQRKAHLRQLMAEVDKHWDAIDAQAKRGSASGYTQAVRVLVDLAEGYTLTSSRKEFERALRRFVVRHATRDALLWRLKEAGLWSG